MTVDEKKVAQLLGRMLCDSDDVITRFIFELRDAIDKKEISKAQDIAEVIEADLKQLNEDLIEICKELKISPVGQNGLKILI